MIGSALDAVTPLRVYCAEPSGSVALSNSALSSRAVMRPGLNDAGSLIVTTLIALGAITSDLNSWPVAGDVPNLAFTFPLIELGRNSMNTPVLLPCPSARSGLSDTNAPEYSNCLSLRAKSSSPSALVSWYVGLSRAMTVGVTRDGPTGKDLMESTSGDCGATGGAGAATGGVTATGSPP